MRLLITTQTVDRNDPILGFFHAWILEFSKHFERIDVICLRKGTHDLPEHVHIHSLGKEDGENRGKYLLRFYYFFTKVFFGIRVEYVFFHMGAIYNILALPFFLVRKLTKTKFYWWKTHGKVAYLKERLALNFCDAVFTAGNKSFDVQTDKVHVVGHAIDTDLFTPAYVRELNATTACITVGRLVPIKKNEIAIGAIREVVKLNPNVELSIVGNADNEAYRKSLVSYVTENKLSAVSFVNALPQHEIAKMYKNSHVLLHPAYEAGFDKVVLEAMSSGVIPLTSIPSFEPILSPFGLYIKPNDVYGYVSGIQRICSLSLEERNDLSQKLRNIVISSHSLPTLPRRIFGV